MNSIWRDSVSLPNFPSLDGDKKTDVLVVGAGMAGILSAFFLQRSGLSVIVAEAGRVGGGVTENTTAKITSQHGLCYSKLIQEVGKEKAGQYAMANQQAVEDYFDLISEQKIECDLQRKNAYLYTLNDPETAMTENFAAKQLGLPSRFEPDLSLPFPTAGAVEFKNQGQFHPLKFVNALAKQLTIYENTRVETIEEDTAFTALGNICAKYILITTHYPFINVPGYYFMRMHQERSYVIALQNAPGVNGIYIDMAQDGLSLRNYQNLLLLGGGAHRTGENHMGGNYQRLRQLAREYFPGSSEVAHWSAQDCMPIDQIPYIGTYAPTKPNWYVATGFGKWGMTGSMVAAKLLCAQIIGKGSPYTEVYDPSRWNLKSAASNLMDEVGHAVQGLSSTVVQLPKTKTDELPRGHGGIVEHNGRKAGVYKNDEGRLFVVSVRCPHMGCQLEWNPDEHTWDCPCHGSRFDYQGRVLNNPANRDLSES